MLELFFDNKLCMMISVKVNYGKAKNNHFNYKDFLAQLTTIFYAP